MAQDNSVAPRARGTVPRQRLIEVDLESPYAATIIAAPSGYGKTVLAAQICGSYETCIWWDCDGREFEPGVLLDALSDWAGSARIAEDTDPTPADVAVAARALTPGTCVVLDDVKLSAQTVLEDLRVIAQVLSQVDARLVVTTRALPSETSSLRHFSLLLMEDMRLTSEETVQLAASMGASALDDRELEAFCEETQGHAAFLAVFIRAASAGLSRSAEDLRLGAWLDHLVSLLTEEQSLVLARASLLGRGRCSEVAESGVSDAHPLDAVAEVMPLVRVFAGSSAVGSARRFVVHDLLVEYMVDRLRRQGGAAELADDAVRRLVDREDFARAADIVDLAGSVKTREFLQDAGFGAVGQLAAPRVVELMGSLELGELLCEPTLMLLWSDALLDCDLLEDGLARARAARVLAEHQSRTDVAAQALANTLDALRRLNRWDEAAGTLAETSALLASKSLPTPARIALLRAAGSMQALSGDYDQALATLLSINECAVEADHRTALDRREAAETAALFPCFARGDYALTAHQLSPWAARDDGSRAQKVDSRGNLAVALVEIGRMDRAMSLLDEAISLAGDFSLAYFLPVLGCAQFADGQEAVGLDSIERGIATALELGAEAEAAQNRVYQAMLLRAAGRFEESLTAAERAYERLCLQDFMDFRRLAALEVAASLLALGDTSAARAWAEPVINAGFGENAHHAFRAAMIIAECQRREGDLDAAIQLLAGHADHVRSENSNFQLGMYSRAFPDLLGMATVSVGAESLPVHLVRLITPEAAERCLRASRTYLDPAEWAELGVRLLGAEQFAGFIERKGRPLCRVRMFGGLDITVGDRSVRERDWKKRKARQLFTMLVLKRGQEVPRDQILEHVWPDLSEEKAKNNFYVAWSTMKSALMGDEASSGPCPYVDNAAGRCRIVRDAVRSDIDEFEELVAHARNSESVGDIDGAIAAFDRLASVYHGDLLPSDLYDDWFAPMRERYRFEFIASMMRMVELLLERDNPCEALVFARRALQVDPYREDLYQAALKCHIAAGQRSAAIETFVACKTQLAEELGLDPSSDTVALYEQILVMEERPRYDDFGLSDRRSES